MWFSSLPCAQDTPQVIQVCCRQLSQEEGEAGLATALAVMVRSAEAFLPGCPETQALAAALQQDGGEFDLRQEAGFWPLLRAGLVSCSNHIFSSCVCCAGFVDPMWHLKQIHLFPYLPVGHV